MRHSSTIVQKRPRHFRIVCFLITSHPGNLLWNGISGSYSSDTHVAKRLHSFAQGESPRFSWFGNARRGFRRLFGLKNNERSNKKRGNLVSSLPRSFGPGSGRCCQTGVVVLLSTPVWNSNGLSEFGLDCRTVTSHIPHRLTKPPGTTRTLSQNRDALPRNSCLIFRTRADSENFSKSRLRIRDCPKTS